MKIVATTDSVLHGPFAERVLFDAQSWWIRKNLYRGGAYKLYILAATGKQSLDSTGVCPDTSIARSQEAADDVKERKNSSSSSDMSSRW